MSRPWFRRKSSKTKNSSIFFNNPDVSNIEKLPNYGYHNFIQYFPDHESFNVETLRKHVAAFEKYYDENRQKFSFNDIPKNGYFVLDYQQLSSNDEFTKEWQDFYNDFHNNSEYCLKVMGLAMHQTVIRYRENNEDDVDDDDDFDVIQVRVINWEPVLQLKDLKVNSYGKLVTVRGTVIKAGHVKLWCKYLVFTCSTCNGTQLVKLVDGNYTVPSKCPTKGCREQSNFSPDIYSSYNRILSSQNINVQELLGAKEYENARVPRTLECELSEDLVNSCIPGDDVTITGVIRVRDPNSNHGKHKQHTVFTLYLEAFSIWNNRKENKGNGASFESITFDNNDYNLINKICSMPKLFRFLVQSLCPNIYGHEIVKAGLLLALFGGTKSDNFRAESHVLIVGDPGLGKSQMLKACSNVAPRGIYVCGNTSTSSGLTVTMKREGNEFTLEAGALTLADQGVCCIDEFDKMPSQHACLLEAMEQQCISIAKAGVICSIPTRATILAAANPAGGHYNKGKTIAENLKMSSPMLSRFDLIFILLDKANEQLDELLSKHIFGLHKKRKRNNSASEGSNDADETVEETLKDRLKSNGENIDHLPLSLFRKYIAYAQKYVEPHLSEEAKELIKEFYISLRKQFQTGDCTPVTARQLNSLKRLTQARAKIELREEATAEDASDVIEIVKFSMIDIFTDNHGILDKTRSQNRTGTSTRAQSIKLLKILQRRSDVEAKALFTMNEIKQLGEQVGIGKDKIFDLVQGLNLEGFLLMKGQGKYQLVTAET